MAHNQLLPTAFGDPLGGCCVTPHGYSILLKKWRRSESKLEDEAFVWLPKTKHQQYRRKVLIQLYCLHCRKTNRSVVTFLLRDVRLIFDKNLLSVMRVFSYPFVVSYYKNVVYLMI